MFLFVRLIQNLLDAVPCFFQDSLGNLYHISKDVVPVPVNGVNASAYGDVFEGLVGLDYRQKVEGPVGTLMHWPRLPIIIASSPDPTLNASWLHQKTHHGFARMFMSQTWSEEEFWVTRSDTSSSYLVKQN